MRRAPPPRLRTMHGTGNQSGQGHREAQVKFAHHCLRANFLLRSAFIVVRMHRRLPSPVFLRQSGGPTQIPSGCRSAAKLSGKRQKEKEKEKKQPNRWWRCVKKNSLMPFMGHFDAIRCKSTREERRAQNPYTYSHTIMININATALCAPAPTSLQAFSSPHRLSPSLPDRPPRRGLSTRWADDARAGFRPRTPLRQRTRSIIRHGLLCIILCRLYGVVKLILIPYYLMHKK